MCAGDGDHRLHAETLRAASHRDLLGWGVTHGWATPSVCSCLLYQAAKQPFASLPISLTVFGAGLAQNKARGLDCVFSLN
jgi:hypothetical protein